MFMKNIQQHALDIVYKLPQNSEPNNIFRIFKDLILFIINDKA